MNVTAFNEAFGNTDIYLIDFIMKGYFSKSKSILDAGCGEGRNLRFFLSNNFFVSGIDQNPSAVRLCNMMAKSYQQDSTLYEFKEGDIRDLPYNEGTFDIVLSSAVLHFAKDFDDFHKMFSELARVLVPDGILFIRMSSDHVSLNVNPKNNFTFLLPIGQVENLLEEFDLEKIEPLKSVVVENERVMTTLLLRKRS